MILFCNIGFAVKLWTLYGIWRILDIYGWFEQGLKLHLDYSGMPKYRKGSSAAASGGGLEQAHPDAWASAYSSVAAGAALVAGLGVLAFMRRAWYHFWFDFPENTFKD